jgi:enoyl-CoA hydratase/carnithine racemase
MNGDPSEESDMAEVHSTGTQPAPSPPGPDQSIVQVEQRGPVLHVRFNRPRQLNAFNAAMGVELLRIFTQDIPASRARVVVLSGNGGNFMAGADLDLLENWTRMQRDELISSFAVGFDARLLSEADVPVVCAIDGIAFGLGFDLALAADYVIATEKALFGLPEADVGVVPMGGSTWLLQQRIGVGRALRVQMLGEKVRAPQALEWGLVAQVVPSEELDAAVEKYVARIARRSALAMTATKRLVRSISGPAMRTAADAERQAMADCVKEPDVLEGVAAIREKRAPVF